MTNKAKLNVCRALSAACYVGPLAYYAIAALVQSKSVEHVFTISVAFALCAICLFVGFVRKHSLVTPIYIMLFAIYQCIDHFMVLLLILTVTTFLNEILFTPLRRKYRELVVIDKQFAKRGL